ncbi:hypothetical protein [Deinococcus roseus]|uniref:Uncharacterized protein n=1 Tax=Deinococcus roseus TaxID=392414 RepID=A0ABQ2D6D2_9DEIO|nr:hypothetical protein [Deinococcus roseus]GGJ45311.1 hypothetical protein GCM10008938_34510 [Deinococcus roseus]
MNRIRNPQILQDIVEFMRDGICQMPLQELENPDGRLEFVFQGLQIEVEILDAEVASAICFLDGIEPEEDRFDDLDEIYTLMEQQHQEILQLAIQAWGDPKWSGEGEHAALPELPYMMGGAVWEMENRDVVILGWEHQDQELPVLLWIRWFKHSEGV